MADLARLREILNIIRKQSQKEPLFKEMDRMMLEVETMENVKLQGHGDLFEWLLTSARPKLITGPAGVPAMVYPTNSIGPLCDEIYKWCEETGYWFEDCDDAFGLKDFIAPWSEKRYKRIDELEPGRVKVFNFIRMKYKEKRFGVKPTPPL